MDDSSLLWPGSRHVLALDESPQTRHDYGRVAPSRWSMLSWEIAIAGDDKDVMPCGCECVRDSHLPDCAICSTLALAFIDGLRSLARGRIRLHYAFALIREPRAAETREEDGGG